MVSRPATWKVLIVSAALSGLGVIGAGAATAQDRPLPTSSGIVGSVGAPVATADVENQLRGGKGASATHTQTRGSTQIHTAPNPRAAASAGVYGPFFNQNRGLGGAGGGGR